MTATDLTKDELVAQLLADPDFLDTLRTATRARAERPMFNVAGERIGVNPLATTGRVVVSPGQTISSASWGNPVWDQSINCFDSAAARDAQWPSPHDGSMCWLADTQTPWIRRSGTWRALPLGVVGPKITGPPSQTDYTTTVNGLAMTVPVVAGRAYVAMCGIRGQQVTNTSSVQFALLETLGGTTTSFFWQSLAANAFVFVTGVHAWVAGATGNTTLVVQITSSAAALRVGANANWLMAEDVGN